MQSFTIRLDEMAESEIAVNFSVNGVGSGGTATSGSDYTGLASTGTVTGGRAFQMQLE